MKERPAAIQYCLKWYIIKVWMHLCEVSGLPGEAWLTIVVLLYFLVPALGHLRARHRHGAAVGALAKEILTHARVVAVLQLAQIGQVVSPLLGSSRRFLVPLQKWNAVLTSVVVVSL